MFRTSRTIAAASIALWAAGAAAQTPLAPGEGPSGQSTAGQAAPQIPAQPAPAPAAPAPAAHPPTVQTPQQQGTPATVLDTQDYESLLGRSVRSAGGDELGRVIDVIIDKDGHPRAAIIDFGGFLGVGTRKIAVDWRALRFAAADGGKERRLSVALTRNQVRVSPEYKSGEPIVVLGPASPAAAPEGDPAAAAQQAGASAAAPPAAPTPAAAPEKAPDR